MSINSSCLPADSVQRETTMDGHHTIHILSVLSGKLCVCVCVCVTKMAVTKMAVREHCSPPDPSLRDHVLRQC